ncbi:hypothetical protein LTR64_008077 [Lithohypha guttulata]|uniref:uncharacterized protein n=1 Tax=Lithohypha guttulata TaxID=1690604 RepID=UPI00315D172F
MTPHNENETSNMDSNNENTSANGDTQPLLQLDTSKRESHPRYLDLYCTNGSPYRGQDEKECMICKDELEENDSSYTHKKCRHSWHKDCLDSWFNYATTSGQGLCPFCKQQYDRKPSTKRDLLWTSISHWLSTIADDVEVSSWEFRTTTEGRSIRIVMDRLNRRRREIANFAPSFGIPEPLPERISVPVTTEPESRPEARATFASLHPTLSRDQILELMYLHSFRSRYPGVPTESHATAVANEAQELLSEAENLEHWLSYGELHPNFRSGRLSPTRCLERLCSGRPYIVGPFVATALEQFPSFFPVEGELSDL